jgi:hypothetical protein
MTLPAQADIVERLRSMPTCSCAGDGTESPNLYEQAADLIESLTADNEALRKGMESFRETLRIERDCRLNEVRLKEDAKNRADALAQGAAEARRLLANSLKEYAPISAINHRREVQSFLSRTALGDRP